MTPTEQEGTVAVDAAARHLWSVVSPGKKGFDDLPPLTQRQLREQVLGPVWAALEALPDRAATERQRADLERTRAIDTAAKNAELREQIDRVRSLARELGAEVGRTGSVLSGWEVERRIDAALGVTK